MATKSGRRSSTSLGLGLQRRFPSTAQNRLHLSGLPSNLNCFDFELTADDMELLRHLPVEAGAPDPDTKDF